MAASGAAFEIIVGMLVAIGASGLEAILGDNCSRCGWYIGAYDARK